MPTLEEIQQEIEAMLDVADDELTGEQRQAMDVYLDELAKMEADKVDAFAGFLKAQEARAKACEEEGKRLLGKAKRIQKQLEASEDFLVSVLLRRGLKRLSGDVYQVSTRRSERVDASFANVNFLEEEGLARVVPAKVEPDKDKIKAALKAGRDIPGCKLVEKYSLQVR